MKNILRLIPYAVAGMIATSLTASATTHTRDIEREFNAADFENLRVRIPAGMINAVTGNDSVIRIEIELSTDIGDYAKANELFDKSNIRFTETGKDLSVTIDKLPGKGLFSRLRGHRDQVVANVNVFVPKNFDLRLDTGSGGIEAVGLSGNIILDTGSGSIKGSDLTGDISADTGSGNVVLSNVTGNVKADTGSGNIDLSGIEGEVHADTGSGNVIASGNIHRFNVDTGSGSIRIQSSVALKDRCNADTGSGGIRIQLPETSGFIMDADVGSGKIECGFPMKDILQKRHSLQGVANNGGPIIRLDTGSGGISVQPIP